MRSGKNLNILAGRLVMAAVIVAAFASCRPNHADADSVVSVLSAQAKLLEATSVLHIKVLDGAPEEFSVENDGMRICGFRQRVKLVSLIDGSESPTEVLSDEELESDAEYVVAIRDIGTGRSDGDDSLEDAYTRELLKCRRRLRFHVLGNALVVQGNGGERIESSAADLIPPEWVELRSDGIVTLLQFKYEVLQLRASRQGEN